MMSRSSNQPTHLTIVVNADDLGRTRSITDAIIRAHDEGVVTRTSILANGDAFEYALAVLQKRPTLAATIHTNLVEGKPVSNPSEIPLLVNENGTFRYSYGGYLLAYYLALPAKRKALCTQITTELRAQIEKVTRALPDRTFAIDGHMHTHMIPYIFTCLASLHAEYQFASVRISRERTGGLVTTLRLLWRHKGPNILKLVLLNFFARVNRSTVRTYNLPHPESVIGVLSSGNVTKQDIFDGLCVLSKHTESVEIIVHPGFASEDERHLFKGSPATFPAFYFHPNRKAELSVVCDPEVRRAITVFQSERVA